jgi:alanyl-tRNA synthetase
VRASGDEGVGVRELAESIRSKWQRGLLVVAGASDEKVSLIVTASEDVAQRGVSARNVLGALVALVDGKGGGTATMAQGGGKNAGGIDAALAAVPDAIRSALRG